MDHFHADLSAELGDYGYIKRDGGKEEFVCIGRLEDLLTETTIVRNAFHHTETKEYMAPRSVVDQWPERAFT